VPTSPAIPNLFAVGLLAAALLAPPPVLADPYGAAYDRSVVLEGEGRYAEAAQVLETLTADYPQDFALFLRLGWLHFQDQRYAAAAARYQRAAELSAESFEARLGLAWCRYYLGERSAARRGFQAALKLRPGQPSARQGLEMSAPATTYALSLTGLAHSYVDHPNKTGAIGVALSVPLRIHESWLLGGTYRYTGFTLRKGNGFRSYWEDETTFAQHEGYVHAGASHPFWGTTLHYAYLSNDASDKGEILHVAGASARLSPWGDFGLTLNGSFYDTLTVLRTTLSWTSPALLGMRVTPGVAYQYVDGEHLASGSVAVSASCGRYWMNVRGRYGEEERPAMPEHAVVYNLPDRMPFSSGVEIGAYLGGGFSLAAGYEYHRLELESDAETVTSDLHLFLGALHWAHTEK